MISIERIAEPPEMAEIPDSIADAEISVSPQVSDSAGTKKYPCPHCPQTFTRQHNLKSHLLIHSQEKKFTCDTCSSKFRRIHDLKRHLKLHTGERPYICRKCGRRFARGDALIRHTKASVTCAVAFVSLEASRVDGSSQMDPATEPAEQYPSSPVSSTPMTPPLARREEYPKRNSIAGIMNHTHLPSILNSSTDDESRMTPTSLSLPPIASQQPRMHPGQGLNLPVHKSLSEERPASPVQYHLTLKDRPSTASNNENVHQDSGINSHDFSKSPSQNTHVTQSTSTALAFYQHQQQPSVPISLVSPAVSSPPSRSSEPNSRTPSVSNFSTLMSTPGNFNETSVANEEPQYVSHQVSMSAHKPSVSTSAGRDADPWKLIRVLENRVRALEERLNSAEGRVSFMEGQLSNSR